MGYDKDDYIPVMDYYRGLPENLKPEANKILKAFASGYEEGEAPPEKMLNSLKALVGKKGGGLEQKIRGNAASEFFSLTPQQSAVGLVGIALTLFALSAGMPYVPLH